jgi:hypothetical protein
MWLILPGHLTSSKLPTQFLDLWPDRQRTASETLDEESRFHAAAVGHFRYRAKRVTEEIRIKRPFSGSRGVLAALQNGEEFEKPIAQQFCATGQ